MQWREPMLTVYEDRHVEIIGMSKEPKASEALKDRYVHIAELIVRFQAELPDARRIEIDIEYPDGGRVKLEARA